MNHDVTLYLRLEFRYIFFRLVFAGLEKNKPTKKYRYCSIREPQAKNQRPPKKKKVKKKLKSLLSNNENPTIKTLQETLTNRLP